MKRSVSVSTLFNENQRWLWILQSTSPVGVTESSMTAELFKSFSLWSSSCEEFLIKKATSRCAVPAFKFWRKIPITPFLERCLVWSHAHLVGIHFDKLFVVLLIKISHIIFSHLPGRSLQLPPYLFLSNLSSWSRCVWFLTSRTVFRCSFLIIFANKFKNLSLNL